MAEQIEEVVEPRIAPVEHYDQEQLEILQKTMLTAEGKFLNVFATLAHHPALLKRFNVLGGFFMTRGRVPERDREIVILRVAERTSCPYEWQQHVAISRSAGVSEDEIGRLLERKPAESWSPPEATLIRFTDSLLLKDNVGDQEWREASQVYDVEQLIELTMLVGFYRMLAGFVNSVRVPLDA